MTQIECPECSARVRLSLPRSATVHSVVVSPAEPDYGVDAAELGRPRELRKPCPNDHPLAVLYDW